MGLFRRSKRPPDQPKEQTSTSTSLPPLYSIYPTEDTAFCSWDGANISPEEEDMGEYLDVEVETQRQEAEDPSSSGDNDSLLAEELKLEETLEMKAISRRHREAQRQDLDDYPSSQDGLGWEDEWLDDVWESEHDDPPLQTSNHPPSPHNDLSPIDDWLDDVLETEHENRQPISTIASSSHKSTDSFSHILDTIYEIEEEEDKMKAAAVEELDDRGKRLFGKLSWEQKEAFYHKATKKDRSVYLKNIYEGLPKKVKKKIDKPSR